jgi:hypothetical protein
MSSTVIQLRRPGFDLVAFLADSTPAFAVRDARAAWSTRGRTPRHRQEPTMPTPTTTLLPSLIRTGVPLLVGYLLAIPVVKALGVTADQATSLVTVLLSGAYYLLVRLAEHFGSSRFGWLLGYPAAPAYVAPASTPAAPAVPVAQPGDTLGD